MTYPSNQPDPSEHNIQVKVLNHLDVWKAHPDIFGFAIPNAGRRSWKTGIKMKAEGLVSGVADLCIMLLEGKSAWLEMKNRKGRQSDEQKGFAARCKRLGHPYGVAYSFEEAIAFLRKIGALR